LNTKPPITIFGSILLTLAFSFAAFGQNPVSMTMSVSPASVAAGGKGTARINASIGGGWNMHSITQGPKPKVKMDPNFGINTESYSGSAAFTVGFTVNADATAGPSTLNVKVRYQVCNDTVCLPPKTVPLTAALNITAAGATTSPTPSPSATPTPTPSPTPDANSNVNANTLANVNANVNANSELDTNSNTDANSLSSMVAGSDANTSVSRSAESNINDQPIWGFIWLAITFGALSLLTPCVFPMIPITVSYFTKHGSVTRAGSVRDALIYALGIIFTFTGLGVALAFESVHQSFDHRDLPGVRVQFAGSL
jgi:thiol:disulfide interchange protein